MKLNPPYICFLTSKADNQFHLIKSTMAILRPNLINSSPKNNYYQAIRKDYAFEVDLTAL